MYKKLHYLVRSVFALSCIFLVLFLNTLSVKAETSYSDLLESTSPVDETQQSFSLSFDCQATSNYMDISGGTYSGNGTYTGTGSSSTSVTGTVSLNGTSVNANTTYIGTISSGNGTVRSFNSTLGPQSGSVSFTLPSSAGSGTTASSGNINITTTHGGSMVMHYKIPLMLQLPFVSGGSINSKDYYGFVVKPSNVTTSVSNMHNITHFHITSADGKFISDGTARPCYFILGSELLSSNNTVVVVPLYIEFDDFIPTMTGTLAFGSTLSFKLDFRLRRIKEYAQSQVGSNVTSDIKAHELQEESNEIQEDTNETTHSIFDSISDFFGSFFNNLIGVFVPENDYFSNWFSRVNTLLNDKLGILYYPFNLLISFFQNLYDNMLGDQSHCYIDFPEIAFTNTATNERYVFLNATTVDLAEYNIRFSNSYVNSVDNRLRDTVGVIRYFSDILLSLALLKLCQKNLDAIIRGSGNDN